MNQGDAESSSLGTFVPLVNETFGATTLEMENGSDPNLIVAGIMMGLVAVFTICLCYLLLPCLVHWLRRKVPVSAAQMQRRYQTIEGWLITKRVVAHSELCAQLRRQCGSAQQQCKLPCITLASPSHDTAEMILEEGSGGQECPICMEPFQVDEIVSWSPSSECEHVFHHACIKTWLIHHDCCPYCRLNVLTVDRGTMDDSTRRSSAERWKSTSQRKNVHLKEELLQLALQRHRRLCTTYFCLEEGLVTLDRPLSTTAKNANRNGGDLNADRRNIACNVSSEEMVALRVHPQSDTAMKQEDVVVTIQVPTNVHAADGVGNVSHFADEIVDIELSRRSDELGLGDKEDNNNANANHRAV